MVLLMKILIDTHLLIWASEDILPKQAVKYFDDFGNILYFSSINILETVIKSNLNKKDFMIDPLEFYNGLQDSGYIELPVLSKHTLYVNNLPNLHTDPFDRILLSQCIIENMYFLTSDKVIKKYPYKNIIYV